MGVPEKSGTGFASHEIDPSLKVQEVPLVVATDESLQQYGRLVRDPSTEEVWLNDWPTPGNRKLAAGTGKQKHVETEHFTIRWEKDQALIGPERVYGKRKGNFVYVREINYHPDSGQVFYPEKCSPFVALLALPGDDVQPSDFRAFYFDGTAGLQIRPSIWHQPLYPVCADALTFQSMQGVMKAIVMGDMVSEHGTWLKVPLKPAE